MYFDYMNYLEGNVFEERIINFSWSLSITWFTDLELLIL